MRRILCVLLMAAVMTLPVAADGGYVALSFDDGPSGANTEALLELLKVRQVSATFFLCGYRIEAFPEQPGELSRAGHELGVHGYSHTCFDKLTNTELREELRRTSERIYELTGTRPALMRPPCGVWNSDVQSESRRAGLSVILWSIDPEDWRCTDSAKITRRVCAQAQNGSIILMHDLFPSSVQATAQIIDRLRERGFEFVTVSQLAELTGKELLPGEVTCRCYLPISG